MTPPKPSLKERIEAIADMQELMPTAHDKNVSEGLRAIASELREIAEEIRIGDDDVQTGNPVGWADRLAREDGT